jgi:hypothetical protein
MAHRPHGGIAPGIDRLVALMAGEPNIREVMAFPKTAQAADLMADAPSAVETRQLDELHIQDGVIRVGGTRVTLDTHAFQQGHSKKPANGLTRSVVYHFSFSFKSRFTSLGNDWRTSRP